MVPRSEKISLTPTLTLTLTSGADILHDPLHSILRAVVTSYAWIHTLVYGLTIAVKVGRCRLRLLGDALRGE